MIQRPTVAFLTLACVGLATAVAQPPAKAPEKAPERAPEKPPALIPSSREKNVDLRPKFEVGQIVRYTMKQISDQQVPNAEDPKDPTKIRMEQTVGLRMTTKAIDKETGEATVEILYETVRVKLDSPLANVNYDSTKPVPPTPKGQQPKQADPLDIDAMVADQYKKMVGTTMTMKMAKDGRISSITGGGSLVPSMPGVDLGGLGGGDPSKQLDGLFGPITTNSSKGFDGTAKVGDKWTHSDGVSVGPLGGLDLVTTYDLRSYDRGIAKVYFSGHAGPGSAGNGGGGASQPVGLESADHKGQYAWDTSKGQLVRCEMEQKVTLSGTLTGGKPSTATTSLVLERNDKK